MRANLIVVDKFPKGEISKSSCGVSMAIFIFFIQQFHKQRNDIKLSEKKIIKIKNNITIFRYLVTSVF